MPYSPTALSDGQCGKCCLGAQIAYQATADKLAQSRLARHDLATGATVADLSGRITASILEPVREGVSNEAATRVANMKKQDWRSREQLAGRTGWLPCAAAKVRAPSHLPQIKKKTKGPPGPRRRMP